MLKCPKDHGDSDRMKRWLWWKVDRYVSSLIIDFVDSLVATKWHLEAWKDNIVERFDERRTVIGENKVAANDKLGKGCKSDYYV